MQAQDQIHLRHQVTLGGRVLAQFWSMLTISTWPHFAAARESAG
jgi:hypothetical protein